MPSTINIRSYGSAAEIFDMQMFKNRLATGFYYFLFAIAFSVLVFPLSTRSANEKQDPTVSSKQIEATGRSASPGQSSEERIALYQALLDLTNPWTVMCVAAHPDDEDGTSLIVMRRKYGAHTVSLFSTFGEGGQNAIGPELYEELGAIRARETMAAAEIQGSEPHFLGLKDFGYSKSPEETFQKWGHEEALRRMVLEIRRLRPDVIITNHSVTSNDHGHHQATARLVVEAFDAAADPAKFPDQLTNGVTTWQVQRLFVRQRGNAQTQGDARVVTIDPNERDPVRGVVYAEEALRALQQHATQGPWPKTFAEFANRFRAFSGQGGASGQMPPIRYALVREAKGATPLSVKESHNFVDGLQSDPTLGAVVQRMDGLRQNLSALLDNREELFQTLADVNRQIDRLDRAPATEAKRIERIYLNAGHALALTSRISMRVIPQESTVSPGDSTALSITLTNNSNDVARVNGFNVSPSSSGATLRRSHSIDKELLIDPGRVSSFSDELLVPKDEKPNVPQAMHLYDADVFGRQVIESAIVRVRNVRFPLMASARVNIGRPVEIMNVTPVPLVLAVSKETSRGSRISVAVQITNQGPDSFAGQLAAMTETNAPAASEKVLLERGTTKTISLILDAKRLLPASQTKASSLSIVLSGSGRLVTERSLAVVPAKVELAPIVNVGYIRGFDFSLSNALNALGVESKELSVDEVKSSDLSKFTSVIVDNRVYESQPELIAANQKLLDYANAGGNLIVFYHKSNEWNPDPRRNRPQLAPYKLILGDERVTYEDAPITFLEPEHPLLNSPNKLGPEDFKDWIQERGLYYPKEWDPQFHALLQSNDPGERPLKGGLLVADYGRGHYIYTSMVWYRQLRAGVPGAYRMLANMISYGKK